MIINKFSSLIGFAIFAFTIISLLTSIYAFVYGTKFSITIGAINLVIDGLIAFYAYKFFSKK